MLRQNRWEKEWMILEKKELRYLERPAGREKTFGPSAEIGRKDSGKAGRYLKCGFCQGF